MLDKIGRRESKRPRTAALEPHFSDVSGDVRGTEDVNGEGDFKQLGPAAERMSSPIPPRNPRDTHDTRDTLEDQVQKNIHLFSCCSILLFSFVGLPVATTHFGFQGGQLLSEVYSSFPN